jgi:hypothetical protein
MSWRMLESEHESLVVYASSFSILKVTQVLWMEEMEIKVKDHHEFANTYSPFLEVNAQLLLVPSFTLTLRDFLHLITF